MLFCLSQHLLSDRGSQNAAINEKENALIASTPLKKPPTLVHSVSSSASNKARKLKEKFQDFAEEEVDGDTEASETDGPAVRVVGSPNSKDDSYVQFNNDSPTKEDEPNPEALYILRVLPSPERPLIPPYESAFLDPVGPVVASVPVLSCNPVVGTFFHKYPED